MNKLEGFLKKFWVKFESLFGQAPTWIHIAQSVVAFAAPVATAIITGFAPELLPVAGPIIAEVQTDLTTVSLLVSEGSATPTLAGAIQRIQSNLSALLAAGHITDKTTVTNVTLVINELAAVLTLLPAAITAPASTEVASA